MKENKNAPNLKIPKPPTPKPQQVKSTGFGDTVEKFIKKVLPQKLTAEPCGGCERRKQWLNKVFPYMPWGGNHRAQVNYVLQKYPVMSIEIQALDTQIYQLRRHNANLRSLYKKMMDSGMFKDLPEEKHGIKMEIVNAAGFEGMALDMQRMAEEKAKKKETENGSTVPD